MPRTRAFTGRGARPPGAVVHLCRAAGVVVTGPKSKAGAVTIPSSVLAYLLRRLDGHVSTLHNVQSAHSSSRRSQVHTHLVESTESTRRNRRVDSTHNPVDSAYTQSSRRASSRRPSGSRLDSVGTNSRLDWRQLDWLRRRLDCTSPPDGGVRHAAGDHRLRPHTRHQRCWHGGQLYVHHKP